MFGYIYKKDAAMIAIVLCLCLCVGSFFDYQISSALFNIGSMYGRFIEAAGELPFDPHGKRAGPAAQFLQDQRRLRPPDVLPAL